MGRSQVTVLQRLINQRRLTREETIKLLHRRAERMQVNDFALSLRQLDRWLSGEVVTLPRPAMCRVIEAEFGQAVERLLSGDIPASVATASPERSEKVDVRALVSASAHKSARFGQWADSLSIGNLALAAWWLRVAQLAVDYVYAPMLPIFRELEAVRDEVFEALVSPDPAQARDLYLLAGTTCGLLAHASGNLGHLGAANVQACAALICARKADNPTLAAWVLGVRALQSEWSGNPSAALTLVGQADAEAADRRSPSTVPVWLAAIEARAYARMGNRDRALQALDRVTHERSRVAERAGDPNELGGIGGILTFNEAKQHYYAGTAYRRIGEFELAAANAEAAIASYATGAVEQRSYGDEAIAWVDLAISRASGANVNLDGAAEALRVIEEQPAERCLPTLAGPLRDLGAALSTGPVRDASRAVAMRKAIAELISSCERPRVEVGA